MKSRTEQNGSQAEAETLWAAHVACPCEQSLADLLDHYLPIARGVVRDFHLYSRADLDQDDVLQVAMMGLLEALRRYDPSRGVTFRSFALRRVKGAVLDLLRKTDVLSRKEREQWGRLQSAIALHLGAHGCLPDDEALALLVGVSVEHMHMLMVRVKTVLSLDMTYPGGTEGTCGCLLDTIIDESCEGPADALVREERYETFRAAFRLLDSRAQKILYLYYYEDLTLREIGQVLELTEARICQLHAKSLLVLRAILGHHADVSGRSAR